MIHSMCGGGLKDNKILSVVKIKFVNNPLSENRPYWYLNSIIDLKQGDIVLAPFSKNQTLYKAEVIRVDNGVNEQSFPIPFSKMQTITSRAE